LDISCGIPTHIYFWFGLPLYQQISLVLIGSDSDAVVLTVFVDPFPLSFAHVEPAALVVDESKAKTSSWDLLTSIGHLQQMNLLPLLLTWINPVVQLWIRLLFLPLLQHGH
jgi:hypothetical protein